MSSSKSIIIWKKMEGLFKQGNLSSERSTVLQYNLDFSLLRRAAVSLKSLIF